MLLKSQTFIYDGAKLIGEYNSDGSVKNEYIHSDHLGTPRRLADENANIVWSWESEPFGESKAVGIVEFNLRFAGQYFDNETKTHYNINRDYNPKTGRYLQSDPIGFDGGVNSYGYVAGNPLGAVDELGLKKLIWLPAINDKNIHGYIAYQASLSYKEDPNICTVHTHGSSKAIASKGTTTGGLSTPKQIVEALLKYGCKKKQKVILFSCNTANTLLSKNPIAKQLSESEEFPTIIAPTRQMWSYMPNTYNNRMGSPEIYGSTIVNGKRIQNRKDKGSYVRYYKGDLIVGAENI